MDHRRCRTRLIARAAMPLLGLAVLAGCEGNPYSASPLSLAQRRAQFQMDPDAYTRLGFRLDWTGYPAITGRAPIQFVQPADDLVLVLEAGSTVTALEATNGAQRWSNGLAAPLTEFVGIMRDGPVVYVASDSEVFVLDASTGNLLDRQRFEKIASTKPLKYGNRLVYGSGVGEVLAHELMPGVDRLKAWGFGAGIAAVSRDPVDIGGVVGAVTIAGEVLFLDPTSGSLLGTNRIYTGPDSNPVSNGQLMFIASTDQSIYAFRPFGGQLVWRHKTPVRLRQQPTAHGETLYCAIEGVGLHAFAASEYRIQWVAEGVQGTVLGRSNRGLVVWDGRTATIVDPARGDVLDRTPLPGVRSLMMDRFDGGTLYAVSESGVVARFRTAP